MAFGMDMQELYLWIRTKADTTELKKVQQEIKKMGVSSENSFKSVGSQARSFGTVIYRLRWIWAATAGLMIQQLTVLNKGFEELQKTAIALGTTTESLATKKYGFLISKRDIETVQKFAMDLEKTGNVFRDVWMEMRLGIVKAAEGFKDLVQETTIYEKKLKALQEQRKFTFPIMGGSIQLPWSVSDKEKEKMMSEAKAEAERINSAGLETWKRQKSQESGLEADFQRRVQQMTLSTYDFKKAEQDRWLKTMEAAGYRGTEIYRQTQEAFRQELELTNTAMDRMTNIQALQWKRQRENIAGAESALGSLQSALEGAGQENKAMARMAQGIAIARAIINTSEGITKALAEYPFPLSTAIAATVGAAGMLQVATIRSQKFERGGWAGLKGEEQITVGEKEPELIIPASKIKRKIESGEESNRGGDSYQIAIYAVDAKSFSDMCVKNPEGIVSVVNRAIQRNTSLRKTIKNYT